MNFLCKLSVKKIILLIKNKKISNYELTKCCLNNLIKINKKNTFIVDFFFKESLNFANKLDKKNSISIPISIKNIFSLKKKKLTSNSNILKNFKTKYNSDIIKILKKNKFNILSIDILDEFCLGSSGINNSCLKNLYNKKILTGGSSSGSCLNISYGCNLLSLGSDTGGSVRTPSSFCNIIGFKPTNAIFSRNGMIPYSSLLDNCSIITNYAEDCKFMFNILKYKNLDLLSNIKNIFLNFKKKKKILILNYKEFFSSNELKLLFEKIIKNFEELNFIIINENVNFYSLLNLYNSISSKDFYSNTCKFDGIKYGFNKLFYKNINDYIKLNRVFSKDCKNKIIKGNHFFFIKNNFNDLEFKNIKKIFENCFNKSNFILIPTNLDYFKFKNNIYSEYIDLFTMVSNILGYPTINLKLGFINHIPIGFQIISNKNYDLDLLNLSILYESFNFKNYVFS
ncbi:amidase family protein [Candidatus Carsonella ruddii]|uniref:Aspartyl-tRNA(Asn) amidotransferase subunit A n=1 Tax=Carsonella ruddii TaxID=114186 RepID=A0A1U9RSC0_CARRU|nr:amidase family protein [Candidatus Carsonella ruddii]AQU89471.1 Aspartyl-tRNA(Asn) amidotransferase subunit A [Candidatus Carsonella ruddii]